jgi:hypothetical protein
MNRSKTKCLEEFLYSRGITNKIIVAFEIFKGKGNGIFIHLSKYYIFQVYRGENGRRQMQVEAVYLFPECVSLPELFPVLQKSHLSLPTRVNTGTNFPTCIGIISFIKWVGRLSKLCYCFG